MKLIKQFTCLVACFVILCSSFVVSAEEDYLFTLDDLIEMGAYENENGAYVLTSDMVPTPYLLAEKNFPNFDINQINWSSMPSYIQDIVYSSFTKSDIYANRDTSYLPFVMVRVNNSSYYTVYVGYNIFFGRTNASSGSLYLATLSPGHCSEGSVYDFSGSTSFQNTCLYVATFKISDNSMTEDWFPHTPTRLDTLTNLSETSATTYVYSYRWIGSYGAVSDFYLYGGNIGSSGNSDIVQLNYRLNDSSSYIIYFASSPYGFSSGNYISSPDSFSSTYITHFTPKTPEQYQQQLQQEQNNKLDNILGATGKPDSIVDDYNKAESDLVDDYNPDNLEDDLDIELDSSALSFIWTLFDEFVTADNAVFTLFISIMSVGIIALILGRQ